jgi:hypothetical protein
MGSGTFHQKFQLLLGAPNVKTLDKAGNQSYLSRGLSQIVELG